MLLRKRMSLLGVGSAKIDLILQKANYSPGEMMKGTFSLKGGTIEQHVKRIECDLIMLDTQKEEEIVIETSTILSSRIIQANEEISLPFTFKLPSELTYSGKNLFYYFKTRLVFNEGVESKDQDYIYIKQESEAQCE